MKKRASITRRLLNRFGLYPRQQVRDALANHTAASINRLTQSWTQTTLSADAQARGDLKILRARSRELRDNNDYAQKFAGMLKTNVLGESGLHFRNKAKDPDRVQGGKLISGKPDVFANQIISEKFYRWGRKDFCTVTGKLNWCDVQNIVLETTAFDGECLIRKLKVPRSENPFGFTLQLLEADYLDDDFDGTATNGNEVRMGVEIDQWGKPVAYHLRTQNPNDTFAFRKNGEKRYRLPSSEVIHLGIFRRPEQTRCLPWLSTSAYRMNMLGKYEEAEVTAARAAACKMGFLIPTNANSQYEGEADSQGNKSMDAEPGALEQLPYGMDYKAVDWNHPNSSYQVFMKTALRGIAAGLGVSYNTLANDMESVNFASGKLGLDDERQMWKRVQYWLIESFAEEVFKEWLELAIITGEVPLPITKFDKFNQPDFRGRNWGYVNPQQEVTSDIARLNSGLTSRTRLLQERGIDREELDEEIANEKAEAETKGLVFPALQGKEPAEDEVETPNQSQAKD